MSADPLVSPVSPELLPDLDQFVIEDGKPVDNVFTEKQHRLLTKPLYENWSGPGDGRTFQVYSDVGLHYAVGQPSLAPDVMLSLDVVADDLTMRENRSYFIWLRGKAPDVVLEIVSDRLGGELTHELTTYARWGIPYYVVFDPQGRLGGDVLRSFRLTGGIYEPLQMHHYTGVNLGLTLWEGVFEGAKQRWLRWCDEQGQLIPTEEEKQAELLQQLDHSQRLLEEERQRREQLEARLRELGLEP